MHIAVQEKSRLSGSVEAGTIGTPAEEWRVLAASKNILLSTPKVFRVMLAG